MEIRRAQSRLFVALIAILLVGVTGCGPFSQATEDNRPRLEKTTLKIGALKLTDSIPLLLARDRGYFADEGLTIEAPFGEKGSVNLKDAMNGDTDIGMTSYPGPIAKQLGGARLKVVADAVQTTPGLIQILVPPGSPIQSLADLVGKKLATSSPRGITELTMLTQFAAHSVDGAGVEFVSMEIADMPDALKNHEVDAAGIAEPFVQRALMDGAISLFDPFSGPTADFPWSGFVTTEKFVDKHPNTVAAFQRALHRAVEDVRVDRGAAEQIATRYLGIREQIAQLMAMPEYPTTVEATRLQRVADMLLQAGEIPKALDMREMVIK